MTARLPDLLVVGAPKGGTTTLVHWLRSHPGVAASARKELEFFDLHFDEGVDGYLAQLPQEPGDRVVLEATPTYLSDARAPERIAALLPDTRFVAVLREPVARAWSQYWFFVQLGLESRSWEQALADERRQGDADPHGYLRRGRYAEQLARWDALVGPDRTLVLLLDDLAERPEDAWAQVCRFAGLAPTPLPGREAVNPTRLPRSRRLQRVLQSPDAGRARRRLYAWNAAGRPVPPLPQDQRAALQPLFEDDLEQLARRLGRPLPAAWRVGVAHGARLR